MKVISIMSSQSGVNCPADVHVNIYEEKSCRLDNDVTCSEVYLSGEILPPNKRNNVQ